MAEAIVQEATPKKVAFMSKPSNVEERIKKDEEELKKLMEQEKKPEPKDEDKEKEEEPKNAEEKTFKKRYGDLRRHSQQKEKELQVKIEELSKQLSEATKKAIVETIAIKKAKETSKQLEEKVKSINELQLNATKEKAEAELMRLHPDFDDIRDSDEFHEWADEQPKWIQDALYDNDSDARSAARAIDLYKADKNITKKSSDVKNDAAKVVKTRNNSTEPNVDESKNYFRESQVEKMSAEQYEKNQEKIMEAIRSGKFIYDLTGSAR
jgi:DNA repair exonuclease SbcCD ATPase subunit